VSARAWNQAVAEAAVVKALRSPDLGATIPGVKCPHCHKPINIGKLIRSVKSKARSEASRANGAKGGRPRKSDERPLRNIPKARADRLRARIDAEECDLKPGVE
jgi:hypothetical protein